MPLPHRSRMMLGCHHRRPPLGSKIFLQPLYPCSPLNRIPDRALRQIICQSYPTTSHRKPQRTPHHLHTRLRGVESKLDAAQRRSHQRDNIPAPASEIDVQIPEINVPLTEINVRYRWTLDVRLQCGLSMCREHPFLEPSVTSCGLVAIPLLERERSCHLRESVLEP